MKSFIFLVLVVFLIGSLISCGEKEVVPKAGDFTSQAKGFVELFAKEDYSNAVKNFDNTMKGVMTPEKLKEAWQGLLVQAGSFKRQVGVRQTKEQGFDIVYVTCEFEKSRLDIKVVFNNAKEISGLWFVPSQ
ncbi:DUF3887 domain-containing protein [candidate division WOR-3 bacterium]|jgi:hypothetical protein|nr:DUF3887 domain-containing protein [candidate division WOR-3 bacterium]